MICILASGSPPASPNFTLTAVCQGGSKKRSTAAEQETGNIPANAHSCAVDYILSGELNDNQITDSITRELETIGNVLHHLTTKTEEEINKALEYERRQKSYESAKEKIRRLQIELGEAEMDRVSALDDLNKLGKPTTSSDKITEKHYTLQQHEKSLQYISTMIFDTLCGPGVEIPWGYESRTGASKEVNLNASPLNSDFILL